MDENMTKFNEKIAELLEIAKKEKNVLVQEEIEAHFKDMDLTPDKMGIICEYLEKNGVDILKTTGDTDVDDDIILEMENEEEEEDLENIDLSVPDEIVWEKINPNRQKQGTMRLDTSQEFLVQSVCGKIDILSDPSPVDA